MATPIVTVGIPVRNGERYLDSTLRALVEQDLEEIQIVVSDNGSTDRTPEILERWAAEDLRIEHVRSPVNRGVPWNFNHTLELARAPYFMWNSADDLTGRSHLRRCVALLEERPEVAIAFSRVALIDGEGSAIGGMDDEGLDFEGLSPSKRVALYLERRVYQLTGFGGVLRTDLLRQVGGLPDFYGGDVALGVRMVASHPVVQLPERTFTARRHDRQTNKLQGADVLDQVRAYRPQHARPIAFPQWFLNYQLARSVWLAPLPGSERLRGLAAVVRLWTVPNWRFLPFDLKRNLVRLTKGRYVGAFEVEA